MGSTLTDNVYRDTFIMYRVEFDLPGVVFYYGRPGYFGLHHQIIIASSLQIGIIHLLRIRLLEYRGIAPTWPAALCSDFGMAKKKALKN